MILNIWIENTIFIFKKMKFIIKKMILDLIIFKNKYKKFINSKIKILNIVSHYNILI